MIEALGESENQALRNGDFLVRFDSHTNIKLSRNLYMLILVGTYIPSYMYNIIDHIDLLGRVMFMPLKSLTKQ